jgi:predicted O-methyltransferase YrrM
MNGRPDPGATDLVRDVVDGYLAEDDSLLGARARAARLGVTPVGAAGGATLCFLAATIHARAVVEVGTGAGVSGLWLLRGMAPDGVLTSIDVDPEAQRAARAAFVAAGYGPSR